MNQLKTNIINFLVGVVILGTGGTALADGSHDHNTTNNYYSAPETVVTETMFTGMGNTDFEKGMAMSAAGDACVFDYAVGWQGCVGGGWYGSQSALNGSVVTRVDRFMLRFNFQTDTDFKEQTFAVGGSWHF